LDAFFTRPFYKKMVNKKCVLEDMESVDPDYYRSLKWMKDNDITGVLEDLTFSAEQEVFGERQSIDLKPNGSTIPVTEENKKEYIDLVTEWRFNRGVVEQMKSFMTGFYDIIPKNLIQIFDEKELELLIAGIGDIDVNDWRNNTIYKGGYSPQSREVVWFWQAVQSFEHEERARLLQFVTGTSKVPVEGFKALYGSNGPQKFCIERINIQGLPRAHTCFNRLDLPPYNSYSELLNKLKTAIEETEGFAME